MKALLMSLTVSLGLLMAGAGHAQAPAAAPAGSTGLCKDGSYTTGTTKRGACRGHQGVKEWYAGAPSAAADSEAAPKTKRSAKRSASDMSAAPAASAGSAMAAPKNSATMSKTSTATAAPASAPAGSTGLCKDGSYYSGDSKRGACRGHKGVKEWYGAAAAAGAGAAAATTAGTSMPATPPPAATPKMPAPAAPAPNRTSATPANEPESRMAAPGGGAGKVWVNTQSKVYHCQDDRYYGKTKQGEYMSEADAIAKGSHASHGKSCGK